jgi:superfamily II DNA/RNA helicase
MPLSRFHPLIAEWFRSQVGQPTDVQEQAWPAIQSGADVLIAAPTGSGKTFATFLSCIDHLFKQALARVPAVPSNFVVFRDGTVVRAVLGREAADRPNEQIEWSGRANQVR